MTAAVIAVGALSPLGRGERAYDVSTVGAPAEVAIGRDEELARLGFARPFCARIDDAELSADAPDVIASDRAAHLLFDAMTDALAELTTARPGFAGERVGVALGTSSGGMRSAERFFERRARGESVSPELARAATYFAPFEAVLAAKGLAHARRSTQLVTACAASTWAIGIGLRWLQSGEVDVVLAGGYDAIGPFVAAGFEAIRATSATCPPQPFRLGRDGMALGEGAAVLALVRADDLRGARSRFVVTGFGASTDAVHITAPDRTGAGLARAARRALADAARSPADVAIVSVHGTATPYNDAMEARAIASVFGAHRPVVHPFKAQIGHTLGAAGALETLAAASALVRGVLPAAAGSAPIDPDADVKLLSHAEALPDGPAPRIALKESAAFGGANAALTVASEPSADPVERPLLRARVRSAARASLPDVEAISRASGLAPDRVARFDDLSLLAATSVARALDRLAPDDPLRARLRGAGVVVGHSLATIDLNERFYARVIARGPTSAEPRLFPPTSPNVMPGQIAILFGLTGPSAATCGSLGGALEALEVATDLVRAGDAETMIVVGLDYIGETSRAVLEAMRPEAMRPEAMRPEAMRPGLELVTGAVAAIVCADGPGRNAISVPWSDDSTERRGHEALARVLGL